MSEIKKNNVPEEINEEELDLVAAGAYTVEEWNAMSVEERKAAQMRSIMAKTVLNTPCELD